MGSESLDRSDGKQWVSAHVCPICGRPVALEKLELGESTTGVITCPKCSWSGQINIKIIEEAALK